ncbi:MAG: hypothetical protein K2Y29_00870 [Beijerinckiaceae bacterium]|nr:hypothetical protein [Beijerinckiaceae bacterium]
MRSLSSILALAAAAGLFPSGAALAQNLPDTLAMTCAQAQSIVQRSGAVVLATGPNLYDRYVRDQSFCTWNERTRPSWTAARDNPQCYVYYRCVPADYEMRR